MAAMTREPELHRLIARGNVVTYRILTDWPAIISRCTTHPHEASWLDRRLRTALHSACTKRPPVDAIRVLVDACGGKDILDVPDKHGRTPLVLAVESGCPESVIRVLLEIHPEAGSKEDIYGELPLHRACYNKCSDAVVRMLLECHRDAAAKETKGGTPLDLAIESGASDAVVRMLIDAYPEAASKERNGFTPLVAAIRKRASYRTIKALLDANPGAAFKGYRGNLPLHEAIEHQASPKIVQLLCDANRAGPEAKNRIHLTPLHLAVKWNSAIDVVQVLLEKAPDVARASHTWVKSPLDLACECFSRTSAVLADASDPAGAFRRSWKRVLLLLCAAYHGSVVSRMPVNRKWRVVHAAAAFGLPIIVLETAISLFPQEVRERDEEGRLPLMIAAEQGMRWDTGLELLLRAYPDALWLPDRGTGLHPFMLSATAVNASELNQVNTIFELLLASPGVICDATKRSASKKALKRYIRRQ